MNSASGWKKRNGSFWSDVIGAAKMSLRRSVTMTRDAVWLLSGSNWRRKLRTWPPPRTRGCWRAAGRWIAATASLEALSPVAILNRGYALVFDAKGRLVKDAARLEAGDELSARLARGRVRARVTATERGEP